MIVFGGMPIGNEGYGFCRLGIIPHTSRHVAPRMGEVVEPGMAYQHATGTPVPTIGMPWLDFPVPSGEAGTASGSNRLPALASEDRSELHF